MRALVTGGAGLIGSHLTDLLLERGWAVRILDALSAHTHPGGRRPPWIPPAADLLVGDVRDPGALERALADVDVVFHLAAHGGYMPGTAEYLDVNAVGTARMLDLIHDRGLPVRRVVVASSQSVYVEGAGACARHGRVFPRPRPVERLRRGDYAVPCPECGRATTSVPTPEEAPIGGDTAYAISKAAQERIALAWGRQTGIPTVALRFSCTYGPRQSLANPYTGLIAIFSSRLVNGLPPLLYEDGEQSRDLCHVRDTARAVLVAAETDALDGLAVNVGRGEPTTVRRVAELVAQALEIPIAPVLADAFRPGEMRHLTSDAARMRAAGWAPEVGLAAGVAEYVAWVREQGDVRERFSAADAGLRRRGAVQSTG